jgi:DnaJ-class molecular chaperone
MDSRVREIVCSQCAGTGKVNEYRPHVREPEVKQCPQCGGTGKIEVMVPA